MFGESLFGELPNLLVTAVGQLEKANRADDSVMQEREELSSTLCARTPRWMRPGEEFVDRIHNPYFLSI
jgi:hypothetical protein